MGAKDDIIEGDKAAGSYDKMAITDFAASLSRKKEDKTLGTGRIHIMKNRYGADGMTYNAKIDTSIFDFFKKKTPKESPEIKQLKKVFSSIIAFVNILLVSTPASERL
jgi:glutamine amidotransferase PdxT